MNQDQVKGILRALVPAAITYCVGRGWISESSAGEIAAAIITLGMAAWSMAAHTESAKLAAVEAMPDVKKIVPMTMVPKDSAVAEAAKDPDRPKVAA